MEMFRGAILKWCLVLSFGLLCPLLGQGSWAQKPGGVVLACCLAILRLLERKSARRCCACSLLSPLAVLRVGSAPTWPLGLRRCSKCLSLRDRNRG